MPSPQKTKIKVINLTKENKPSSSFLKKVLDEESLQMVQTTIPSWQTPDCVIIFFDIDDYIRQMQQSSPGTNYLAKTYYENSNVSVFYVGLTQSTEFPKQTEITQSLKGYSEIASSYLGTSQYPNTSDLTPNINIWDKIPHPETNKATSPRTSSSFFATQVNASWRMRRAGLRLGLSIMATFGLCPLPLVGAALGYAIEKKVDGYIREKTQKSYKELSSR